MDYKIIVYYFLVGVGVGGVVRLLKWLASRPRNVRW